MSEDRHRVHVAVYPEYGYRLGDLPAGEPVWVDDCKSNRPVIQALWQERTPVDLLDGITSFRLDPKGTPEDWPTQQLTSVDIRHGEYSHNPPYLTLNVFGVKRSVAIQEELDRFGFGGLEDTADGFGVVGSRDMLPR